MGTFYSFLMFVAFADLSRLLDLMPALGVLNFRFSAGGLVGKTPFGPFLQQGGLVWS